MKNLTALTRVELALSEVGAECGRLSELEERAQARQAAIAKLEGELSVVRLNRDGLEQRSRATRLTNTTALLSVEHFDVATLNGQIENQAGCVIEAHRRAIDLLQQVWAAVLATRKASVEKALAENFDLRLLPPVELLSNAALSVIEVDQMQHILFAHRGRNDRDGAVNDARLLRERSESLIEAARNEPDLVLDLVLPSVTPVASQPKHVVSTNQHGTLAQPQYA